MNQFGVTLKSLMDLESIDQETLARRVGFSRTKISRIQSGLVLPDRADLPRLVTCISADRGRRLSLLLSFLQDWASTCDTVAGFDSRHYIIAAADEFGNSSLGADLRLIAEQAAVHEDLRVVIGDLARLLRRVESERSEHETLKSAVVSDVSVGDLIAARKAKRKRAANSR